MNEKQTCEICGIALEKESVQHFEGEVLCPSCLESQTVICDNCGRRVWREDSEGDAYIRLCRRCFDYNYTTCEDCGRIIPCDEARYPADDSDNPYCDSCYGRLFESAIKSYYYKPEPIFFGPGSLYLGVELEVDCGGENQDHAKAIMETANTQSERIYCKHDGSLEDGFEIVSYPMTLEYHTRYMNWREILEKAVTLGYLSHNASSCGLHIHCPRCYFGDTDAMQEEAIGRVVYFFEKHWNELVKFSRRSQSSLNRWAAKYATISDTTHDTYEKAKGRGLGRYVAVNLTNSQTVEFRMFRGTLRYKTFMATLQLTDEICRTALLYSDREIETMSWCDFVSMIDGEKKPELVEYLKSKRLYVNENFNAEEEM